MICLKLVRARPIEYHQTAFCCVAVSRWFIFIQYGQFNVHTDGTNMVRAQVETSDDLN
jgi:hypothetical protein